MHLFLNPPHMLWAIEDTDIRLTRGRPFYELDQEEINLLDDEQLKVLNLSLQAGTITQINPEFIPANASMTTTDFILTRKVTEIQRKYISRMVLAKDLGSLAELLEKESAKERPRSDVLELLRAGLKKVREEQEGGLFYEQVGEIDDDLFEEKVSAQEAPGAVGGVNTKPLPKPKRRGPRIPTTTKN